MAPAENRAGGLHLFCQSDSEADANAVRRQGVRDCVPGRPCGQVRRKLGSRDEAIFRFCMEPPLPTYPAPRPISCPIHQSVNKYLCNAQYLCVAQSRGCSAFSRRACWDTRTVEKSNEE